jgi:hypothetical protein
MSPEKIESTMLTTLKPTFDKLLKDDMGGIGQAYSLTEVEVCELFREQGDAVAKELQLEKVNPALFKALTEAP